jgi:phenylacetate-CoA ligase
MSATTAIARAAYQGLRAAHLHSVRAALEDHVARVEWPRERIDRYRTERLRALLAHARERSPFHAARMGDVPWGQQVFSSGGSSGVRGVYVWGWELFVTLACLAWRMQAREERLSPATGVSARLAVLEAGEPPHASTPLFDVPIAAHMGYGGHSGRRAVRRGARGSSCGSADA